MTKAELVEGVSKTVRQPKRTVERVLDSAFDQIARSIKKDKRFSVPDFGTFSIRRRRARAGYNPHTKAPMVIPAARTIGFRPAPQLKNSL